MPKLIFKSIKQKKVQISISQFRVILRKLGKRQQRVNLNKNTCKLTYKKRKKAKTCASRAKGIFETKLYS